MVFSIVEEEALLTGHSEIFSAHGVYDFPVVASSSYATKLGIGFGSPRASPITCRQVTS